MRVIKTWAEDDGRPRIRVHMATEDIDFVYLEDRDRWLRASDMTIVWAKDYAGISNQQLDVWLSVYGLDYTGKMEEPRAVYTSERVLLEACVHLLSKVSDDQNYHRLNGKIRGDIDSTVEDIRMICNAALAEASP